MRTRLLVLPLLIAAMLVAGNLGWAGVLSNNEIVNGDFEVDDISGNDPTSNDSYTYNCPASGYTELVDMWWIPTDEDTTWDDTEYYSAGHSLKGGLDGDTVWQIFDEREADWWLDTSEDPDEWKHGPSPSNPYWKPGTTKEVEWFMRWKFDTDTESEVTTNYIEVELGWDVEGDAAPADPSDADWDYHSYKTIDPDGEVGSWNWTRMGITIPQAQPKWMYYLVRFHRPSASAANMWIDDVELLGKCDDDAPELGTWTLLLATAVFGGGFIRRRRRD